MPGMEKRQSDRQSRGNCARTCLIEMGERNDSRNYGGKRHTLCDVARFTYAQATACVSNWTRSVGRLANVITAVWLLLAIYSSILYDTNF